MPHYGLIGEFWNPNNFGFLFPNSESLNDMFHVCFSDPTQCHETPSNSLGRSAIAERIGSEMKDDQITCFFTDANFIVYLPTLKAAPAMSWQRNGGAYLLVLFFVLPSGIPQKYPKLAKKAIVV